MIELVRKETRLGDDSFSALEGVPPGASAATPRVFWSHATGFHAAAYAPFLRRLAESVKIWAPDARGHGHSRANSDLESLRSWHLFYDDLVAALDALPHSVRVVLAGHSFGATASVFAAAARPFRVSALVLVEPVFYPPGTGASARVALAKSASRRRDSFVSLDEAYASYRSRNAFAGVSDQWLKAYVDDAFVRSEDGGYHLRCSPAWESRCYDLNERWPWWAIARTKARANVLVAERGSSCPESARWLLRLLQPSWQVNPIAGTSHLLPMEKPDAVFDAVMQVAKNSPLIYT